jgi:hypothetical protein
MDLEKGMEKHLIVFWVEGIGGMDAEKFDSVLNRLMELERLKDLQLFILPNYDVLFEDESKALLKQCEDTALKKRVEYNTLVAFSGDTPLNVLKNSKYLCEGYKTIQLFGAIPTDIPGIVVAAGPSLNKNIKDLKKAKGKAFIIAVDTALKPLLREGIVPDMFFIVDAQKPLELVQVEGAEQIPMVTTLNATPEILNYHKGKKFFFDESYLFAEKILKKSGLPWGDVCSGGSVATNAFSLLYKIGLKTIILVGQDLALTGKKTHADGTFEETMPEVDTRNCIWVEGNCEDKVPTEADLKVFLNWYESSIQSYKEHTEGFRVINATEGGAKIKGTEVMALKEAIAEVCTKEVDIVECLDSLSPMLNEENRKWAKEYLVEIPKQFGALRKEAQQLGKCYRSLENSCRKSKMDSRQYVQLLKKIKKQIGKVEKGDLYQLIEYTLPSATKIIRDEEFEQLDTMKEEGLEVARKGKLYSKLVADTAKILQEESEKIFMELKEEEENGEV